MQWIAMICTGVGYDGYHGYDRAGKLYIKTILNLYNHDYQYLEFYISLNFSHFNSEK